MKRIIIAAMVAVLLPSIGFAQFLDLQPAAIVKLTKTESISVKEFKTEIAKMENEAGRSLTVDERRKVLDVMINERLALQAAERDKVSITDAEVNAQLSQLRAQLGGTVTDAQFAAAIKADTGMELDAYRENLKKQLIIQKYVVSKKRDILEAIKAPTEEDIKAFYDLTKYKYIRPDTVRFSLIIVPVSSSLPVAEAKALADKLHKEIGGNASKFDELMIRAQAKDSQFQARDGGYLPRTKDVAALVGESFIRQAFALKVGDISPVMSYEQSFQIMKISESYLQKFLELGDLAQLGSSTTVREFIANQILQERSNQAIEKAQTELITELRAGDTYELIEKNINW